MGFEYKFKITREDLDRLHSDPRTKNSLDNILQTAPGFISNEGKKYLFKNKNDSEARWPSEVYIMPEGLLICIYSREESGSEMNLLTYLMQTILEYCGRVEVYEA